MITTNDYFMGRREAYALSLSPAIEREAARTVNLINALLARALPFGVHGFIHPVNKSPVSSGWRPPAVNANTPNAAPNSKHMTGQACDLYDPEGVIDDWLMSDAGMLALKDIGLWIEHPAATKGWAHIQTVPQASFARTGLRYFYP